MKLGFSYKFLFYLLLIVVLAYIVLKHFNVIEGNKGRLSQRVSARWTGSAENRKEIVKESTLDSGMYMYMPPKEEEYYGLI